MPFPRAKIFMGDSGSQFLGFLTALLPLLVEQKNHVTMPVLYSAALLMIPVFDTCAAVWRRVRDHRDISKPDKSHVHHKLMNMGLGALGVDIVLYSLQIILGALVYISICLSGKASLFTTMAAYMIGLGFFAVVHFRNKACTNANQ